MKLFDDFEAIRFPEENLIFITHREYLYYIYDPKYKHWRKHRNAGYDLITVRNYEDVSKEALIDALGARFPQKETDILAGGGLSRLHVGLGYTTRSTPVLVGISCMSQIIYRVEKAI